MYKLCIKLFVGIVLCNSAYGIHVEVINAPELRGYNNEIAKDIKNMPKQVLDQIFSFLYPPMHVPLKQGPESHDIQFSAEVIEYISRIQEVAESRIEITDLSINR